MTLSLTSPSQILRSLMKRLRHLRLRKPKTTAWKKGRQTPTCCVAANSRSSIGHLHDGVILVPRPECCQCQVNFSSCLKQGCGGYIANAVFSLNSPGVFRSGRVGRPSYLLSEKVLQHLRSSDFTWPKISQMFLVLRWTLRRRIIEYGLEEMTGFSIVSGAQLDNRQQNVSFVIMGLWLGIPWSPDISDHQVSEFNEIESGRVLPPLTLETLESAGRSLFLAEYILWLVQIAYGILTDTIAWWHGVLSYMVESIVLLA